MGETPVTSHLRKSLSRSPRQRNTAQLLQAVSSSIKGHEHEEKQIAHGNQSEESSPSLLKTKQNAQQRRSRGVPNLQESKDARTMWISFDDNKPGPRKLAPARLRNARAGKASGSRDVARSSSQADSVALGKDVPVSRAVMRPSEMGTLSSASQVEHGKAQPGAFNAHLRAAVASSSAMGF